MYVKKENGYIISISEIAQKDMEYIKDDDKELQDYKNKINKYSPSEEMKRKLSYKELRKYEYPEIGEVIDALCKANEGDDKELKEIMNKRKEIKAKYPKE